MPCYAPLYGRAASMLSAVQEIIDLELGAWVPIVLHAGWEADDGFRGLEQLAELIEPYAASWDDFLAAVDRAPAPTRRFRPSCACTPRLPGTARGHPVRP